MFLIWLYFLCLLVMAAPLAILVLSACDRIAAWLDRRRRRLR